MSKTITTFFSNWTVELRFKIELRHWKTIHMIVWDGGKYFSTFLCFFFLCVKTIIFLFEESKFSKNNIKNDFTDKVKHPKLSKKITYFSYQTHDFKKYIK